jgi:hypothetical protein
MLEILLLIFRNQFIPMVNQYADFLITLIISMIIKMVYKEFTSADHNWYAQDILIFALKYYPVDLLIK